MPNMGLQRSWEKFWTAARSKRTLKKAGFVAGAWLIFTCGVLFGNGTIRIVPISQYTSRTSLPAKLDYSSLNEVYDALRQNYDGKLTTDDVLNGLKHGLAGAANDPYTEFFTPKEAKDFNGMLEGVNLTGIGVELDQDKDGNIVVMSPLDGSPASAAGIRAKDVIIAIDGNSTAGLTVNAAVAKIRGTKGTDVTLRVLRGSQTLDFTITRDTISVPTATSKILDDGTGYLQISQFSSDTFELVQKAVASFQQNGVRKIVLDLRDNPGGEVDSAQDIASLWLPDNALIMQERRGNTVVDSTRATGTNPLKGMPTVVLVNAGSASAAEITALALKDGGAATIIGEKSYGKGVVQQVLPFSDGSELKVTIARWYSPKGTSIDHKGITPDQTVAAGDDPTADPQLGAAQAYLNR
ncbi:MAG TPA: S41 family peptidase [Candidatus Saccharimonadales bacterium]|nr:S41 family peptidase [Candidatus Saccharimonadales bacterium]